MSFISDTHIKTAEDYRAVLGKFFDNPQVAESEHIFLLGDIFDLMVGDHKEYRDQFGDFFDRVNTLLASGKNIYYVEGNHDFHLENLFAEFFNTKRFFYYKKGFTKKLGQRSYYFTHGDDLEIGNRSYKVYRAFVGSPPLRLIANHAMPYSILEKLGSRASKKSKMRNKKRKNAEGSISHIRDKFRSGAEKFLKKNIDIDFIVAGHNHVQDNYLINDKSTYLNIGYPVKTGEFLVIENNEIHFVKV